jgi:uncharacterized protein DUF6356
MAPCNIDLNTDVWRNTEGGTMATRVAKLFTDHPASVGETYFGHMAFAAWFASRLFAAAGAALVHAFLPFLFESTASRIIRELYERTHNRRPAA